MKRGFNLLMIVCVAVCALACNNNKSYTDMLNAEKKAINRLRSDEGLTFLSSYPESFASNEFYRLSSGVYINVVDSGNGVRPSSGTTIHCRFSVRSILGEDTIYASNIGPNSNGTSPIAFTFGTMTENGQTIYSDFFSAGLASGSQYVGDSSEVKLIVPFTMGSSYFSSNGIPVYFDRVQYRFQK